MNMNQAKTDAKFKDLTETIHKTQLELKTAEVSFVARTINLTRNQTRVAGSVGSSRDEDRAGKHQQSAPVQPRHLH
jgi:hypothetical protein